MSNQSQVWKKRAGGLDSQMTEQRQSWLNPTDTSRKALAGVARSAGKQKAGLKRREN